MLDQFLDMVNFTTTCTTNLRGVKNMKDNKGYGRLISGYEKMCVLEVLFQQLEGAADNRSKELVTFKS